MIAQSITSMMIRGLRPAADLAANRPHGDRLRYIGGCRCDDCRQANTDYERERSQARAAGDWNGIVDAGRALAHIKWLSKRGIGRRAIAAASDVSETCIADIRAGKKTRIRARTERNILAVTQDAASDRALINAGPSWKLINELLSKGVIKSRIARELGYKGAGIQLNKHKITVRNAYKVQQAHARLINSDEIQVDASRAKSRIRHLRAELISALHLARELGMECGLKNGELRLPQKITRRLEKQIEAIYRRYIA